MGRPPSLPALHTRLYVSGMWVWGGLSMWGASGTEAFFCVGKSTPLECTFTGSKLCEPDSGPSLGSRSSFWVASEGMTNSAFVFVSKGTAQRERGIRGAEVHFSSIFYLVNISAHTDIMSRIWLQDIKKSNTSLFHPEWHLTSIVNLSTQWQAEGLFGKPVAWHNSWLVKILLFFT